MLLQTISFVNLRNGGSFVHGMEFFASRFLPPSIHWCTRYAPKLPHISPARANRLAIESCIGNAIFLFQSTRQILSPNFFSNQKCHHKTKCGQHENSLSNTATHELHVPECACYKHSGKWAWRTSYIYMDNRE